MQTGQVELGVHLCRLERRVVVRDGKDAVLL